MSRKYWRRNGQNCVGAFVAAVWLGWCMTGWANIPLRATSLATPEPASASASRTTGKSTGPASAATTQSRPTATLPQETEEEQLGPLEDLPSSATVWLLDSAREESVEALELGETLKLTGRIRLGDAEIYIIETSIGGLDELPILNLQEAREKGLVDVRELSPEERTALAEQYPSGGGGMVVAQNKSDMFIMIIGGEVLEGGNQDRLLASSAILPPRSTWIPLPVNCVEKGRSQGDSPTFEVLNATAHPMLRALSLCRADQNAVWNEIRRVNQRQNTQTTTETYVRTLMQGKNRASILKAADSVQELLRNHPKTVGLVFAWRGQAVSMERFGTPSLFAAKCRSVLYSHMLGLATMQLQKDAGAGVSPQGDVRQAADFLSEVSKADRLRAPLNHQGVGVVLRGARVLGTEVLTNLAPRDPALRTFASSLRRGGPTPGTLHQWAVVMN